MLNPLHPMSFSPHPRVRQKHLSQKMMRARVLAQGFTIAVLAVSSFYSLQIKPSQQLALVHYQEEQLQKASVTNRSSSGGGDRRRAV